MVFPAVCLFIYLFRVSVFGVSSSVKFKRIFAFRRPLYQPVSGNTKCKFCRELYERVRLASHMRALTSFGDPAGGWLGGLRGGVSAVVNQLDLKQRQRAGMSQSCLKKTKTNKKHRLPPPARFPTRRTNPTLSSTLCFTDTKQQKTFYNSWKAFKIFSSTVNYCRYLGWALKTRWKLVESFGDKDKPTRSAFFNCSLALLCDDKKTHVKHAEPHIPINLCSRGRRSPERVKQPSCLERNSVD